MIDNLRHMNHSILGIIVEGLPALGSGLQLLVNRVAIDTLISIAISIPLFLLHHNLWALGFVVGFVLSRPVREVVEKVNVVVQAQQTFLRRAALYGGGGFLALLTMPTSLIIATLYYSAQWGSLLYESSFARVNQHGA